MDRAGMRAFKESAEILRGFLQSTRLSAGREETNNVAKNESLSPPKM